MTSRTAKSKKTAEEEKKERGDRESDLSDDTNYERMPRNTYFKLVQSEMRQEKIDRAIRLNEYDWDVEEFLYHEKQPDGNYSYLDKFYDDNYESLSAYYEACLNFMKQGHLPKEIQ